MIAEWIIDVGVAVVRKIWSGILYWFFDPVKWKIERERERLWWLKYKLRADMTADDTLDDHIASCIAIRFKFRTGPGEASLESRVQQLLGAAMVAVKAGQADDAFKAIKAADDMLDQAADDLKRVTL